MPYLDIKVNLADTTWAPLLFKFATSEHSPEQVEFLLSMLHADPTLGRCGYLDPVHATIKNAVDQYEKLSVIRVRYVNRKKNGTCINVAASTLDAIINAKEHNGLLDALRVGYATVLSLVKADTHVRFLTKYPTREGAWYESAVGRERSR